jgi:hypothetical protein
MSLLLYIRVCSWNLNPLGHDLELCGFRPGRCHYAVIILFPLAFFLLQKIKHTIINKFIQKPVLQTVTDERSTATAAAVIDVKSTLVVIKGVDISLVTDADQLQELVSPCSCWSIVISSSSSSTWNIKRETTFYIRSQESSREIACIINDGRLHQSNNFPI